MSELVALEPTEITVFDGESNVVSADIDSLLDAIRTHELKLATGYAKLGRLLLRVQMGRYWIDYGCGSFGQYVDSIKERIGKQRSQIYSYVSVAEKLLPCVSESDLERMGISRAQELARFVKQSDRKVPSRLLEIALRGDNTLSELHTAVLEELNERGEVKGNWYDFGGFYCTADEKKEIQAAVDRAKAMNPSDAPEHVQRKEVVLMWAREFISSYPDEAYR